MQGIQIAYDLAHGIHSTFGNLFYTEETGCLTLFELSLNHRIPPAAVDLVAVKNAVFSNFPEYVIHHNRREQAGLNDGAGLFLQMLGADVELAGQEENLLNVTPTDRTNYLKI